MLSSVLRSETAVRVNIEIMRAFVRLRRAALVSTQVMALVADLWKRVDMLGAVITDIVESLTACSFILPRQDRPLPLQPSPRAGNTLSRQ